MGRIKISKGDTVVVIAGDDKGKTGRVLKILTDTQRLIIEKVNFVKRHIRPTQKNTQGGIQEKEAPIHLSNVMLVDPKSGERTRAGVRLQADGRRERFAKKSGEALPRTGR